MKYSIIGIFIFLFSGAAFSQKGKWNELVPAEYTVLDSARGDLNQDGFTDIILILKSTKEPIDYEVGRSAVDKDSIAKSLRPLLILHGQKEGGFKLAKQNNHIVLGVGYGMYSTNVGITITDTYFSINLIGYRWERKIIFKYDLKKGGYFLQKDTGESYRPDRKNEESEQELYNEEQWNKTKFENYIVE